MSDYVCNVHAFSLGGITNGQPVVLGNQIHPEQLSGVIAIPIVTVVSFDSADNLTGELQLDYDISEKLTLVLPTNEQLSFQGPADKVLSCMQWIQAAYQIAVDCVPGIYSAGLYINDELISMLRFSITMQNQTKILLPTNGKVSQFIKDQTRQLRIVE